VNKWAHIDMANARRWSTGRAMVSNADSKITWTM